MKIDSKISLDIENEAKSIDKLYGFGFKGFAPKTNHGFWIL
jgi:hypothetical protein